MEASGVTVEYRVMSSHGPSMNKEFPGRNRLFISKRFLDFCTEDLINCELSISVPKGEGGGSKSVTL